MLELIYIIFTYNSEFLYTSVAIGLVLGYVTTKNLKQQGSLLSFSPDSRLKTAILVSGISQIVFFLFFVIGFLVNPIFVAFAAPFFVFYNPVFTTAAFLSAFAFAKDQQSEVASKPFHGYAVIFLLVLLLIYTAFFLARGSIILDLYKKEIALHTAVQTNNYDYIESQQYQHVRDRLYYDLAIENKDAGVCNRIGNTGSLREACFSNLGIANGSQSDNQGTVLSPDISADNPIDLLEKEVEESRADARDALGEATLANLRSRAEIYAFNKLDVSYEGWCDAIEDTPPGLIVDECVDAKESWALSAKTTGTNQLKCVDSENGVVNGNISTESGLCEQGEIQVVTTSSSTGENQVTAKSNLSAQEIEQISNESIEKIREVADGLEGVELQIVTAIPNLKPGEAKEWRGMTVEPVGDYPVIMISGTAATRADLAAGAQAKGFLGELLAVPNFDPLLPTNALSQASDIEFDMVVVVTGE